MITWPAELSAGWQLEAKHRPAVLRIRGLEIPVLGMGEAAGDGEPDPCPPTLTGSGALGSVEAVEDAGQVLGGDAGAGIRHGCLDRPVLAVGVYLDAAARGGVPQGIVQEG